MLSNHNNREFLKDIDRREYIKVDQLKQLYEHPLCLNPCSYLIMEFAQNQNLYQYISRKNLSEKATIYYFN